MPTTTPLHPPAAVQHALESAIEILKKSSRRGSADGARQLAKGLRTVKVDVKAANQRALSKSSIEAIRGLGAPDLDAVRIEEVKDEFYVPQNREAALIQSAMDRRIKLALTPAAMAEALPIGEPFSNTDPGWAKVTLDVLERLLRGRAKFPTHKKLTDFTFDISDQATMALFSDWGTGRPEANAVGRQIEARNPEHVIHLGDVYYSGEEDEVQERFLDNFPAPLALLSRWALNGNHEMYCGGRGYFNVALPALGIGNQGQPASYFALVNAHWKVIGLDSAYDDTLGQHGDLDVKDQLKWLDAQLQSAGDRKCILLTHHQPYSAFERPNDKIAKQVDQHLKAGRIHAWFWGHEHKHVVFQSHRGTLGRCIGNGAIPYAPPSETLINGAPPVEFVNRRTLDGVHGVHTFAHLKFDGSAISIDYVDHDGTVAFSEVL